MHINHPAVLVAVDIVKAGSAGRHHPAHPALQALGIVDRLVVTQGHLQKLVTAVTQDARAGGVDLHDAQGLHLDQVDGVGRLFNDGVHQRLRLGFARPGAPQAQRLVQTHANGIQQSLFFGQERRTGICRQSAQVGHAQLVRRHAIGTTKVDRQKLRLLHHGSLANRAGVRSNARGGQFRITHGRWQAPDQGRDQV